MKTEAKEDFFAYNDYRVYNNVYTKRRVNKKKKRKSEMKEAIKVVSKRMQSRKLIYL